MIRTNAIVIRHATRADDRVLADLAALDSRPALHGPALIAEVDGVARAALDLTDQRTIADPFVPTAVLVDLLRVRARRNVATRFPARTLRERVASVGRRTLTARA